MQLEPYLHFDGTCEEALAAYTDIFGGKIGDINRFAGSPMESHAPAGWGDKVMHTTFHAPGIAFMASDAAHGGLEHGVSRVSLSLSLTDEAEGQRIFEALSSGGNVTAPYVKQFWGASFGMVTDRFGIDWMINAGG